MKPVILEGLEDNFDNDSAEKLLGLSFGKIIHTSEFIRKSMYDFDLETPEGIEKLMALLPIMDPDILKDIMTEIWVGYPTEVDGRRHRMEIRGVLLDRLELNEESDIDGQNADITPQEPGTSQQAEAPTDNIT